MSQHGVYSSKGRTASIQFELYSFGGLKTCSCDSVCTSLSSNLWLFPPCLNTFQIHIKKIIYGTYLYTSLSPYPQRIHITNTSTSVAFHCSHTEFWKPKSASKDTDDSDSDSQSGEDLTVRCWLPGLSGDDDLRLVIDVSCIAEKTVRGPTKPKIGMVDSSSDSRDCCSIPWFWEIHPKHKRLLHGRGGVNYNPKSIDRRLKRDPMKPRKKRSRIRSIVTSLRRCRVAGIFFEVPGPGMVFFFSWDGWEATNFMPCRWMWVMGRDGILVEARDFLGREIAQMEMGGELP